MSLLSYLFPPSKPAPEPVISPFVKGLIDSMANHSTDWSREGDEFVHAPTGMTIKGDILDGEYGPYIMIWLTPAQSLSRLEENAIFTAYMRHLKKPSDQRAQAALTKKAAEVRAHFEGLT